MTPDRTRTRRPSHPSAWLLSAALALGAPACGSDGTTAKGTTPGTAGGTVAGPATSPSAPADTSPGSGEGWTYTDTFGNTVTLDAMPERLVMFEDVAASLMDFGVRPVGIHYLQGAGGNALFDDLDTTGIESAGELCDNVNVEAVAALKPDLILYMNWGEPAGEAFCLSSATYAQLTKVAPILQIRAEGRSDEILAEYLDLAIALGADPSSADLVTKRERYEAASARLAEAVAARPEITVIPMSVSPDWAGVAEPGGFADLVTLRDRFHVHFSTTFEVDEFTGTYWDEFSGETIDQIRGDVILMDAKNATPLQAKLDAYPLWAALPEVRAGQIVDWFVPGSFSYTRDAAFMESLAEAIEQADDLVP